MYLYVYVFLYECQRYQKTLVSNENLILKESIFRVGFILQKITISTFINIAIIHTYSFFVIKSICNLRKYDSSDLKIAKNA